MRSFIKYISLIVIKLCLHGKCFAQSNDINKQYEVNFGNCIEYNHQGEYEKAVSACTLAHRDKPGQAVLLLHIGRNLHFAKKYEEALENYEKYQRERQRLALDQSSNGNSLKETLGNLWSCPQDAAEQSAISTNSPGIGQSSTPPPHQQTVGRFNGIPQLRLLGNAPFDRSQARISEEVKKAQEAAKKKQEADIQSQLKAYYDGLDKAFDEALRQDGSQRTFLLLRGCTQLFLGNTREAVVLFEQYQKEENNIQGKNRIRLREAYQSLLEKLAFQIRREAASNPGNRLPTRLLAGRVLTAMFRLDHSSAEAVSIQAAEDAICNFDRYWEPSNDRKARKAPPPKDPLELETYQTAAKTFKAVYEREKDLRRLPLFIGRAYWLAGEPSIAKSYHRAFEPEPGDRELHKRYLADDEWLIPAPLYKKWYFWLGIVGGAVAVTAIGVGVWAATRPPMPQIINF